jgi:uncharacterized membrane protein YccC
MALPVAWAYVELGLPGRDHSLAHAASLGAAYLLGGGFTLLLTLAFRLGGPHAPTKAQIATAYRALGDYIDGIAAAEPEAESRGEGAAWTGHGPVAPETRVRVAIAEARRVAAQGWANQQGPSRANQRLMVLIETADRLFALVAVKREMPGGPGLGFFADACRAVAAALVRRTPPVRLRTRLDELYRLAEAPANAAGFGAAAVDRRIASELAHAVLVVAGDAPPPGAPVPAQTPKASLKHLLEPLTACLDPRSVVARHALRFAVVAAAAVTVFWVFPPPFGYWVPLTVTVVLKPYAGMTLARTVQRVVGTVSGILVGLALMPLLPGPWALGAAMAICFFCMMAVLPFNYSLAVFFLSAGLIPFEHVLDPDISLDVGLLRIVATFIGALLAVVGGHLLWPSFERNELAAMLRAAVRSMAAYVDAGLQSVETGRGATAAEAARQQVGLDISNLQAALLRSLSEVGGDPVRMQGLVRASSGLQRLMLYLNAVRQAAPAPAPIALKQVRTQLAAALGEISEGRPVAPPVFAKLRAAVPEVDAASVPATHFLVREIERMMAQTEMLSAALADQTCTSAAAAAAQPSR